MILDIFSRYAVGWMVAERETAGLAGRLIEESCLKHGVQPRVLTLSFGSGIAHDGQVHGAAAGRPGHHAVAEPARISNDNPYSEAQFKTVKYHPGFPGRFGGIEEAKDFCRDFFMWYNAGHRHGGIGLLTPEQVHFGRAPAVIEHRQEVLAAAYAARPDRFVAGPPCRGTRRGGLDQPAIPVSVVDGAEAAAQGSGADGKGGITKLICDMSHNRWQVPPLLQHCAEGHLVARR